MNRIFFLTVLLSFSLLGYQQVFADHIADQDDAFWWREFDVDDTNSVWCTFDDITPYTDNISLHCEGGVFDSETRTGALLIFKTFAKADIQNVGGDNTFTWTFNKIVGSGSAGHTGAIMDGAYVASSLVEPGGFPNNADYGLYGCNTTDWETSVASTTLCLGNANSDLDNIVGTGSLMHSGVADPRFSAPIQSSSAGDGRVVANTVTNANWLESTQDDITVFLVINKGTSTNIYIQPVRLTIDNTPSGTMQWDFPTSTAEATLWDDNLGYTYSLNGTTQDYGYFWSYDPTVPQPPTNAFAVVNTGSIDVSWTAPTNNGGSPITGYKIERESPEGGGFSTLVANTGDTSTTYNDATTIDGTEYNYRIRALNLFGQSDPSNETVDGSAGDVIDLTPNLSCPSTDSSFELFAPSVTQETVGLCWDSYANATTITGYQINYTTPHGDPITVVTNLNDTATPNEYTQLVGDLASSTDYSFRVQAWMSTGGNLTNIVNVTTLGGQFDIGDLGSGAAGIPNPNLVPYLFSKNVTSSTSQSVYVDFSNTIDPTCNIAFRFAQVNQTYANVTSVALTDTLDRATFVFNGTQDDVIRILCYDDSGAEGRYVLTQEEWLLKTQLEQFKDGTYGTQGEFGAIDMITLVAVILAMIGFNRVNAPVGVIFTAVIIGVLAVLELINWETIALYIVIAPIIILLAITSHNRGDISD